MAAEQAPGYAPPGRKRSREAKARLARDGRVCLEFDTEFGPAECGVDIGELEQHALRCKKCQHKQRMWRQRRYDLTRADRKSKFGAPFVARHNEPPRTPIICCKVCFNQPWCREPGRVDAHNVSVATPDGLCRGCREPYAPHPDEGKRVDGQLRSPGECTRHHLR